MKAILIDYGAGNVYSVARALTAGGAQAVLEANPRHALRGDVLVLPGVGAFTTAAERISPARDAIASALRGGHPCLGICLGMQLLFERSDEGPGHGLALVPGDVRRLTSHKIPHMGWNTIESAATPLMRPPRLTTAYFANSFVCQPRSQSCVLAWTIHETQRFPAIVRVANTLGVQFHPEKSGQPGLDFIAQFLREVAV